MTWFTGFIGRSIGKKLIVGLTGLGLFGFVVVHLAGNLLLFAGRDTFNHYAETLEGMFFLIPAEIGLLALFLGHIIFAGWVTVENFRARPSRYAVKRAEGGRTSGSATMWLTGIILVVFTVIHVFSFRFAPRGELTLYDVVVEAFRSTPYVIWYVGAMIALGLHVSHGFQSAFRTYGLVHPRYTPSVIMISRLFAVVFALGFSSIPLWVYFFGVPNA